MQRISPCLWFDNNAEEAAEYYVSIFENSKIISKSYYGEGSPFPAGTVLTIVFEIDGQEFMGLNGGPVFKFSEAVSFSRKCDTQEEIDRLWETLSEGGEIQMCGWLKDKYGLSWQIVPSVIEKLMQPGDDARTQRVTEAIFKMRKLDIATLQKAYDGE